MKISVKDVDELRAVVLAMKAVSKDLRADINKATRDTLGPEWKRAVAERVGWAMEDKVLVKGARIAAGNPPAAVAANSKRKLSGGLVPADNWQAYEFGTTNRGKYRTYDRKSKNGGSHKVRRRTSEQLKPFKKTGRVIYPAFAEIAPRAVSLWAQLIVKKVMDAYEGKGH